MTLSRFMSPCLYTVVVEPGQRHLCIIVSVPTLAPLHNMVQLAQQLDVDPIGYPREYNVYMVNSRTAARNIVNLKR